MHDNEIDVPNLVPPIDGNTQVVAVVHMYPMIVVV